MSAAVGGAQVSLQQEAVQRGGILSWQPLLGRLQPALRRLPPLLETLRPLRTAITAEASTVTKYTATAEVHLNLSQEAPQS